LGAGYGGQAFRGWAGRSESQSLAELAELDAVRLEGLTFVVDRQRDTALRRAKAGGAANYMKADWAFSEERTSLLNVVLKPWQVDLFYDFVGVVL
jgi:hypothetical protein